MKQVDRLLSNKGIDVWELFGSWVPFVVGDRQEIVAAIDWTEYDEDNQSTVVLSMPTNHGRATPLLWKTVVKSQMHGRRAEHEDLLLERFRRVLPQGVKATILADRGFAEQSMYELLKDQLGFDFVVRFRGIVRVTSAEGETKSAVAWTPNNGCSLLLRGARVTKVGRELGAVVCLKAKGMKEAWHLATSFGDKPAAEIVKLYSKRFTIEESFRDQKNLRFGMGLSETRIGTPARRDRMLLVSAIAIALLTILGARRRGHRDRPAPEDEHGEAPNALATEPGPLPPRGAPKHEAGAGRAADGEVRRDAARTARLPRGLRAHLK